MPPSKARTQFDQGLALFHRGEYEKAISYFEEVVYEEPENAEALYNLACCCSMTENFDNAILYLDRAVRLNPHCVDWAKEDHEFENLRGNELFNQVVTGHPLDADDPSPEPSTAPVIDEQSIQEISAPETEEAYEYEQEQELDYTQPVAPIDPPPKFQDRKKVSRPIRKEDPGLPPCLRCDGLVALERRPRYNSILMLFIIYIGILCMTLLFLTMWGLFGIPITLFGLYCFSRIDDSWVCQNCGANGKDCGQPVVTPEKK